MRETTCCFSGHRDIPARDYDAVAKKLEQTIRELEAQGIVNYGAGGALGFDTLAAQTILKLRKELPQLRLILVLPCLSQADRWSLRDKLTYKKIIAAANKVVYTSKQYTRDCMFVRNRHLVDYSGTCVCYLTKSTGGTAYTVNYAKQNGLRIINLAK